RFLFKVVFYQNSHGPQLLFGSGFRVDINRHEKKKEAAKHERETREEIRKKDGVVEKPEEVATQKVREEAADAYGLFHMRVDRHWTHNKLEEMSERDWCISKEDYNIS